MAAFRGTTLAHSDNWRSFFLFFKEALLHPWSAGAFFPSSRALADAMARPVALYGRGIEPERLVVVERCPALAANLRARFPQLRIVQDDARNLGWFVGPHSRID